MDRMNIRVGEMLGFCVVFGEVYNMLLYKYSLIILLETTLKKLFMPGSSGLNIDWGSFILRYGLMYLIVPIIVYFVYKAIQAEE
ncbi:MAG: hypothetical protein Q4A78_00905 [Peptostreptococcaceae bacterium]|nr:hypothetical protein [Peptostreptococcaceae bacterium]